MNYIPGSCVHNFAASIGLGGLRDPKLSKPTIKNSIRTPSLGNNHISPTIYLGTFESSMIFPTSLFGGICFLVSWGGRVSAFFFPFATQKRMAKHKSAAKLMFVAPSPHCDTLAAWLPCWRICRKIKAISSSRGGWAFHGRNGVMVKS